MLVAKKLKEENIAEYLLYMWQVEDLLRANDLDIDALDELIINKYDQPEEVKLQIREWYIGLIDMMRREAVVSGGHLVISRNVIDNLTDLHTKLLNTPSETDYISSYYRTLLFIVELRAKSSNKDIVELETAFSALYGFLLMRLQNKEISGETQAAISQISSFLRLLSQKYKDEKEGKLED